MLETELLQDDLARLQSQAEALKSEIVDTEKLQNKLNADVENASQELASAQSSLDAAKATVASINEAKKSLEEGIKNLDVPEPADIVQRFRVGEEQYLIGLKVEGKRIVFLIDSSSSMTDEILIDVIRRKSSGPQEKQNGPKWQRTLAISEWLVNRTPKSSSVALVSYNDNAVSHTGPALVKGNNAQGLQRAVTGLRQIVPEGPTNLEAGLTAIAQFKPTDIYVVTDGLPTKGTSSYKSLNPFADCSALWGGSSKISGACRAKLFIHTVQKAQTSGIKINVVLLPIEGDPAAASFYWRWTATHNGLMISPAASWP